MNHLETALKNFIENDMILESGLIRNLHDYIEIDVEGHSVKFTIQDGPIKKCGVNGVQITDVLEYVFYVYKSLDAEHPCKENELTIRRIWQAICSQNARTMDRIARDVEGCDLD